MGGLTPKILNITSMTEMDLRTVLTNSKQVRRVNIKGALSLVLLYD